MDPTRRPRSIARAVEAYGGAWTCSSTTPAARRPATGSRTRASSPAATTHWRAILEFNLLAAVRVCRAALPLLLERGGGAIVNVVARPTARQPRR